MIERMGHGELPHPLFDPTSIYRTASRGTIWAGDHGEGSIQRFFLHLLRDWYLQHNPMQPPGEVPPGVFPPHVYELHYRQWEMHRVPPKPVGIGGAAAALAPNVFRFDVSRSPPGPGQMVTDESIQFSGQEEIDRGGEAPQLPSFGIWSGKPITPRCRWLALLVAPDLVGALATALGQPTRGETTDREALAVLSDAIRCLSPGYEAADTTRQDRVFNVAILLALAPALEGTADPAGSFRARVDLNWECPVLPSDYRLVFFEGPLLPDLGGVPS